MRDPLSAFVRWDSSIVDDSAFEVQRHGEIDGMRLYWGAQQASLRSYDRSHFKQSCAGFMLIGARIC